MITNAMKPREIGRNPGMYPIAPINRIANIHFQNGFGPMKSSLMSDIRDGSPLVTLSRTPATIRMIPKIPNNTGILFQS